MNTDERPFIRLSEIRDNLDHYDAESLFRQGWVYLGIRVKRSVAAEGDFEDKTVYVLGKPTNQ